MCHHLSALEKALKLAGIKETYRGEAWGPAHGQWVYFDCYLDLESLKSRFQLPDFVKAHHNDDPRSGQEEGLICETCKYAIMGLNRKFQKDDGKVTIT